MRFLYRRIWILILHLFSLVKGQSSRGRPSGPLTDDFQNWLVTNGYEGLNFDRPDIGPSGSFGGRKKKGQKVRNFVLHIFNNFLTDVA